MSVNIVCSHHFRMCVDPKLSRSGGLKEFEMDLGMNYTKVSDKGHLTSNIKDSFVLNFYKKNSGVIYKVGLLGSLSLYTYSLLPVKEIWVFKDDKKHVFEYNDNVVENDVKKYLGEILSEI